MGKLYDLLFGKPKKSQPKKASYYHFIVYYLDENGYKGEFRTFGKTKKEAEKDFKKSYPTGTVSSITQSKQ